MSTICPGCKTAVRLRRNGVIGTHRRNARLCPSSGKWPEGAGPENCAKCAALGEPLKILAEAYHATRHPALSWNDDGAA